MYRQGSGPTGSITGCIDLELAYGVFSADKASLVAAKDLGLKDPALTSVSLRRELSSSEAAERADTLDKLTDAERQRKTSRPR